eukprot:scpid103931/ scgid28716/ 
MLWWLLVVRCTAEKQTFSDSNHFCSDRGVCSKPLTGHILWRPSSHLLDNNLAVLAVSCRPVCMLTPVPRGVFITGSKHHTTMHPLTAVQCNVEISFVVYNDYNTVRVEFLTGHK